MNEKLADYLEARYFSIAAFLVNEAKHGKDIVRSVEKLERSVAEIRGSVDRAGMNEKGTK